MIDLVDTSQQFQNQFNPSVSLSLSLFCKYSSFSIYRPIQIKNLLVIVVISYYDVNVFFFRFFALCYL